MSDKIEIDLSEFGVPGKQRASSYGRQDYQTSVWKGTAIEDEAKNGPNALYNATDPNMSIQHENAGHRLVLYLKTKGTSNRDIARITGYAEQWVSQITRQPWFRARLCAEMKEASDGVQEILKGALVDSIYTLIEVRDTAPRPADRKAAADSLIDRVLGKAVQHVETKNTNFNVTSSEIADLDRQVAELEAEARRLSGTAHVTTSTTDQAGEAGPRTLPT